jgi:uncharacterized protein
MEIQTWSIAEKNADLVRRGYEAFNTADIKALSEIFHKDSSWQTPGKSAVAGIKKGRDAVFAQFGKYGGDTNGTFKATLKDVCAGEDGRVVGIHHNSGIRNGKKLDSDCCIVFEFKDGQLISGKEYFFDLNNWDEFWS